MNNKIRAIGEKLKLSWTLQTIYVVCDIFSYFLLKQKCDGDHLSIYILNKTLYSQPAQKALLSSEEVGICEYLKCFLFNKATPSLNFS